MNMHRSIAWVLISCAMASPAFAGPKPKKKPATSEQRSQTADAFVKALAAAKYDEPAKFFDKKMKEGLPADKLEAIWKSLEQQCGKFKSFGPQTTGEIGGLEAIFIEAQFEKAPLKLQIVFSKSGKITGFWIKPADDAAKAKSPPPPYDEPSNYTEKNVEFGKAPWTIKGKLTVPRARVLAPVVVLVHGSGPHDEDETIGPNKPFRDLAAGLSSNGVAVLRYQKRTFAHGAEMVSAGQVTVRDEVIDDALEALKFVRTQTNVDTNRVYLLGHSLGASLAPQIATDDGKLAGIILLSGTPRNFYDVILDQLSYIASLPGPDQAETKKAQKEAEEMIALVRAGKSTKESHLLGVPITYWNDLNRYEDKSVKQAAVLNCRILVCGGGRDYQITKTDFKIYSKGLDGKNNATFKWHNDLNHLFMSGKGMATPAEYEKPGHVDKKVIDDLAKWIHEE